MEGDPEGEAQALRPRLRAGVASTLKRWLPPAAVDALRRKLRQSSHKQWLRAAMYKDLERELEALGPRGLDAVEISGAQWEYLPWQSHTTLTFPEFDLCAPPSELAAFDVVVCDQVLEHVRDPLRAVDTLRRLMRPGGYLIVGTPFLVRLHYHPGDYWRFTPDGLKLLLQTGGLTTLWVRSWGNRRVVTGNFDRWRSHRPWQSMRNEPLLPVVVWALARAEGQVRDTAGPDS
jgi:SAM-dependent methyltransferase